MLVTTSILPLDSSPSEAKKKTKAPTCSSSLDTKVVIMERKDSFSLGKTASQWFNTSNRINLILFKWITSCHSIWRKEIKSSCLLRFLIQLLLIAFIPSHSLVTKSKLKTKDCFKWKEFVFCENFNFKSKLKGESDVCVWLFLY